MTVYTCKVFDGQLGEWVDCGVFSTPVKAQNAGTNYINEACDNATQIDFDWDTNTHTDWYMSQNGRVFTRVITECELDKVL